MLHFYYSHSVNPVLLPKSKKVHVLVEKKPPKNIPSLVTPSSSKSSSCITATTRSFIHSKYPKTARGHYYILKTHLRSSTTLERECALSFPVSKYERFCDKNEGQTNERMEWISKGNMSRFVLI